VSWAARLSAGVFFAVASCFAASKADRIDPSERFFTTNQVVRLSIRLDAAARAALQLHPRAYVKAVVAEGATEYGDVGLHLKGQYGTFQKLDGKPSLTLNLNKFVQGQNFHGLDKFHLNNSVSDPTYLTELLCREPFRQAGVPVARVTHARVEINGRDLGLYVLVEGFGKTLLRRHFTDRRGNLYDSEFTHDVNEPLRKASGDGPDDHSDLQALVAAAEEPDSRRRTTRLDALLDLDRFQSFMALELMQGHFDGYTRAKNNYWLYGDPTSRKMVFLPHGMDQMFVRPQGPVLPEIKGLVARSVLQTSAGLKDFRERCVLLFTNHLLRLTNRVAELQARLRPAVAELGTNALAQHDRAVSALQRRIAERVAQLRRQLLLPPLVPVVMAPGAEAWIHDWLPILEQGKASIEPRVTGEGAKSTEVRLLPEDEPVTAVWQGRVCLPAGRYQVFVSVAADQPVFRGTTRPVALRVWGAAPLQVESMVRDPQHFGMLQIFEAGREEPAEVWIQCEFRTDGIPVAFQLDPVKLTRIE